MARRSQSSSDGGADADEPAASGAKRARARTPVPKARLPQGVEVADIVHNYLMPSGSYALYPSAPPGPLSIFLAGLEYGANQKKSDNSFVALATWVRRSSKRPIREVYERLQSRFSTPATEVQAQEEGRRYDNVLRAAQRYAMTLSGQRWADTRHIILALLTPREHMLPAAQRAALEEELGVKFADYMQEFLGRILRGRVAEEKRPARLEMWRELCTSLERGELPARFGWLDNLDTPTLTIGGFTPEMWDEDKDALGIRDDVEAFASLFAAREVKPPLSVGLFGPWGSGKSYFMRHLESAVARLTAAGGKDTPFLSNVVQVRFNAWHYADADIWASLTSAFFDQLRYGGPERENEARYGELVRDVAERAEYLDAAARAAKAAEIERLAAEVEALKAKRSALDNAPLAGIEAASAALAQAIDDGVRGQLQLLRIPDPSSNAAEFAATLERLDVIRRTAINIAEFVRKKWVATIIVAAVSAIGIAAMFAGDVGESLGSLAARAGLLWASFAAAAKVIEAVVGRASVFIEKYEERRTSIEARRTDEREKLDRAIAAAEERRTAEAHLVSESRRVYNTDGSVNAAGVLQHFLVASGERERFDAALGIVSRARLAFYQLNRILMEAAPEDGPAKPERVILYIDDLDRCAPEQVYEVLQAVHLLIGFPSFVTVVGVDERWVRTALKRHASFVEERPNGGSAAGARDDQLEQRPSDYLEKIFQIPFWLRPLTTSDDGTYRRLLSALCGAPVGAAEAAGQSSPLAVDGAGVGTVIAPEIEQLASEDGTGADMRSPAAKTEAQTPKTPPVHHQSIEFSNEEIEWMQQLGTLTAKSPRAVKRFVNTCRLIRVRIGESNAEYYWGQSGGPPGYAGIMLALAIEVGRTREECDFFAQMIDATEPGEKVADRIRKTRPPYISEQLHNELVALVEASLGSYSRPDGEHWRRAVAIARRYSFNTLSGERAEWYALV